MRLRSFLNSTQLNSTQNGHDHSKSKRNASSQETAADGPAPDGQVPPRQLRRDVRKGRRAAGQRRIRVLLPDRRLSLADHGLRDSKRHRRRHSRGRARLPRRRHRPREEHAVPAVADPRSLGAVPAVHHAGQRYPRPAHSDAEGTGPRFEAGERVARAAELPGAAGRRHPDGARRSRARRQGPDVTHRAHARGRPPLQSALQPGLP